MAEQTRANSPRAAAADSDRSDSRRKRRGDSLRVNFDPSLAITEHRFYWVGVLPDCPCEGIDIGGTNFNKVTETVSGGGGEKTVRIPRIGAITKLTEHDIDRIAAKLPRTVIRFHPKPANPPENYKRRGHLITIPTKEEIEARIKANIAPRTYTQSPLDESVADYIFAVPCSDQQNPNPGHTYPPPLSETGLDWE